MAGARGDALHNILSQVNLLEAIRDARRPAALSVVGSSEEYGMVYEDELPIRETNPLRPLSPYAVSKVTQDLMGYQYFKSYGLPIVRTRAFNHEGPRRGDVFVTSNFAKQVAEIEAGLREPVVRVGDLKPRRDFSDVRDIVRGYWLLLERGEPGEVYNLCSGRAWAIQQVLEFLIGASTVKGIAVEVDPERLRPSDVMVLEGDPSKIEKATGGRSRFPSSAPSASSSTTGGSGSGPPRADRRPDAMRVALVHDWLTGMRGGERCLEVVLRALPRGRSLHAAPRAGLRLPHHRAPPHHHLVHPAAARRGAPGTAGTCRCFPPPCAASTSAATTSCCPRATRWPSRSACPRARCTCATASRRCATSGISTTSTSARARAWPTRAAMPPVAAALRRWDRRTAAGVHHFVAISRFVADRIRRAYGRSADVIHPPVDVAALRASTSRPATTTWWSRRWRRTSASTWPSRRPNRLGAGSSSWGRAPRSARLRALAGPTVEFLGWRDDDDVARLYARCRALVFPPLEDFGITPLEAMAAGRPVIALGQGGALETVVPPGGAEPPTGLFFARQTVEGVIGRHASASRRTPAASSRRRLRRRAEAFDRPLFKERVERLSATRRLAEHGRC